MQHKFFALISRMRFITRWGLMRNSYEENIQEHSHMMPAISSTTPPFTCSFSATTMPPWCSTM